MVSGGKSAVGIVTTELGVHALLPIFFIYKH